MDVPNAPITSLNEGFRILEERTNLEKGIAPDNPNRAYRLDRMRALCRVFDNPQDTIRTVHVAGSKGKGSTAAYLAAILHNAGRKVGIYSSPHLSDYRERFRIEGTDFPEGVALQTMQFMFSRLGLVEESLPGEGEATTFELLTLFAFLFFPNAGCDTIVLETGLGGRLDATNVVSHPEAILLTPIEKEHVEVLGKRLSNIAAEKAGIMKSFSPVWSGYQRRVVRRVFRRKAREQNVPLVFLKSELHEIREITDTKPARSQFGWELRWKNGHRDTLNLAMGGRIQAENAALALMVARRIEPSITAGEAKAISQVRLPGRFQFLNDKDGPSIVIDGAHTPRSIFAVAEAFSLISGRNPLLVFGSVLGKNHRTMAKILCGGSKPFFRDVIVSTPGTFKPSDPPAVAASFKRTGAEVHLIPEPQEAWLEALRLAGGTRSIFVCGSFFMAGEIARLEAASK